MDATLLVTAAATIVTAAASVVLAIATLVYVLKTGEAVEAAKDGAESARASAIHAARAIDATERAMLAQSMPLVITQVSTISAHATASSISFVVRNVGKSTAVNGIARYDGREEPTPPIPPGKMDPRTYSMPGVREGSRTTPSGDVELEYQDAIGNRLRTTCTVIPVPDRPMYFTELLLVGGWEPLKVT